jgi:hypothetical protein
MVNWEQADGLEYTGISICIAPSIEFHCWNPSSRIQVSGESGIQLDNPTWNVFKNPNQKKSISTSARPNCPFQQLLRQIPAIKPVYVLFTICSTWALLSVLTGVGLTQSQALEGLGGNNFHQIPAPDPQFLAFICFN